MSRAEKREGAAVAASASDLEIARLQSEWERVRGQRLALEKQQERARSGHADDTGNTTAEPIDVADAEEDAEDARLVALQTEPSTDPFACCCRPLKLKKLGQNYILHERRVLDRGRVTRELILVGPHWVGVLVTLSIIVGSTGLFLHQQCTLLPWYYSAITLGFCAMTLYYLYGVACKDPGIVLPRTKATDNIPREDATTIIVSDDNEQHNIDGEESDGNSGDIEASSARARRSPPPTFQSQSHAYARFSPRARFCDVCEVHQDAYTEHCDDCGVCIEDMDHHCPWMGKCIGKRNMHAFRMFNVAWVFYVIFVLFVSIQNVDWSDVAVQKLHRLSTGEWVPVPPGTTEKAQ